MVLNDTNSMLCISLGGITMMCNFIHHIFSVWCISLVHFFSSLVSLLLLFAFSLILYLNLHKFVYILSFTLFSWNFFVHIHSLTHWLLFMLTSLPRFFSVSRFPLRHGADAYLWLCFSSDFPFAFIFSAFSYIYIERCHWSWFYMSFIFRYSVRHAWQPVAFFSFRLIFLTFFV